MLSIDPYEGKKKEVPNKGGLDKPVAAGKRDGDVNDDGRKMVLISTSIIVLIQSGIEKGMKEGSLQWNYFNRRSE